MWRTARATTPLSACSAALAYPVHVSDFHATLLKLFGYDHLQLGYDHLGVMQRLTPLTRESKVIDALLA
jgi:hypothetical protein